MSADECKQILTKSIERREEDNELRRAKNAAAANGEAIGEELLKYADDEENSNNKDLNNNVNSIGINYSNNDTTNHKEKSISGDSQKHRSSKKEKDDEKSSSHHSYQTSYVEAFDLDLNARENVFFQPNEPIHVQITGHDEEPSLVVLHTNVYSILVRHGRFSWTIKRRYKQFLKLYEAYALFKTKLNIKSVALSSYLTQQQQQQHASAESSKFKPSDHFKLIFQTIASDFNQAKNILEKFLQEVVEHKLFRNHNETLKFLEVSHLSFVGDLGDKNKEGIIKKRSFNMGLCYAVVNVNFFWESRWLVVKDTWIGYLNPQTGLLKSVVLVDQGFRVQTGADATGTRNGLAIDNLSRSLIVKCYSEKRAHEWRIAILQMLFTSGQRFLAEQRFGSFAPIRDDSHCKWFVDGCDYMDSIADSIEAAKEEIFITGFFLSPEIHLKRPMVCGDKWRLDKLLKRKAEAGVRIYVLIYKEIELTLPNNSAYSKRVLALSHKNIKVLRHPDRINDPNQFLTIMWAHHEKLVIVDQSVAYFGGIDLAYGRWDNHLHRLTDLGSVLPPKTATQSQAQLSKLVGNQKTTNEEQHYDMLPCEDKSCSKSDQQSVRLLNFKMRTNSSCDLFHCEPLIQKQTTTTAIKPSIIKTTTSTTKSKVDTTNTEKLNNEEEMSSKIAAAVSRRAKAVRMFSSPGCSLDRDDDEAMMTAVANMTAPATDLDMAIAKQSRLDRFFKSSGLKRSKSLEEIDLTRVELLNELQFPVSQLHPTSSSQFQPINRRLRSIKDRLSRARSQTVKAPHGGQRREYGELTIFNKFKKIRQFKESLRRKPKENDDNSESEEKEDNEVENYDDYNEPNNDSFEIPSSEQAVQDLQGSSKYWIGKDYCNFIYKDVKEVHTPFKDSIDRTRVPRMPWHDVGGCVCGPAARDIARHFIQRWNYVKAKKVNKNKNYPLLMPKSYQSSPYLYPPGLIARCTSGCRVQVVRSVSTWSSGQTRTESSIHAAMKHLIANAESYVYIENQFFVSLMDDSSVQNGIVQCLFERILLASRQKTPFKCYILVPLIPGYEGEYGRSSGVLLHAITHYNNASINGLIKRLADNGVEALNYICFFSLRTWDELNNRLVSELIYVHSKLMIVDDRACLIGSANINDRSLLGNRDSEVALLIEDTQMQPGILNKRPTQVGLFCSSLRQRLFRELLGEFRSPTPNGTILATSRHSHGHNHTAHTHTATTASTSSSSSLNSASNSTSPTHSWGAAAARRARVESILLNESSIMMGVHSDLTSNSGLTSTTMSTSGVVSSSHHPIDITDPCSDDFYKKVLLKYAAQNTKIYDQVFNVIPSNYVNNFQQLKEYQKAISLSQRDPNEAKSELAKVKGYIVLYPNRFLCYEDLKPPLGTKEKLMPNIIWT